MPDLSSSYCPLCQKENNCLLVKASKSDRINNKMQEKCWCFNLTVNNSGLKELSKDNTFNTCLCKTCLENLAE